MTKAQYPSWELGHSWRVIEELADSYACVVKLGGRQTQRRKTRASVGRLCVKGANVDQCFYAIVRESRRAFRGNGEVKFTSKTAPSSRQQSASRRQTAKHKQQPEKKANNKE